MARFLGVMKTITEKLTKWLVVGGGVLWCASASLGVEEEHASLVELLEQGVYLQEAEKDLDRAIDAFSKIIEAEQVSRAQAAEAQFRLAVCYVEKGDLTNSIAAFEALIDKYPDQEKWTEAALAYAPQEFTPKGVPWKDNERLTFVWQSMKGKTIGYSSWTITSDIWDGNPVWNLHQLALVGGSRYTIAEFDKESFKTTYSRWHLGPMGTMDTWYEDNQIRVKYQGKDEEKSYEKDGLVYDNEQAIFLFRQMPLDVGYSELVKVFVPISGITLPVDIKVRAIEDVETPYGLLECFKIDLVSLKQTVWVTTDENRYVAKLEVGGTQALLSGIDEVVDGKLDTFEEPLVGYKIEHPNSWRAWKSPNSNTNRSSVNLVNPFLQGVFSVQARRNVGEEDQVDADKLIQQSIKNNIWDRDEFALDESGVQSWEEFGIEARSFKATYREDGEMYLMLRYVYQKDERYVSIGIRSLEKDFHELEADLKRTAQSFEFL